MLFNSKGDHCRMAHLPTEQEAHEKVAVMQRDLGLLSTHAWCEKYRVPVSFVECLRRVGGIPHLRR